MKKILSLLLSVLMLGTVFAGCKGKLPVEDGENSTTKTGAVVPEKDAKIKFRTADKAFGEAVAAKFKEKYPDITVQVEESNGYANTDKLATELPSGEGPDIFMCADDYTSQGVKQGLIAAFLPEIADNLNKSESPIAMKGVTRDGKVYGVPISIETYVLFYNKAMVKGEPATTFEQIKKESEAYNDPKNNKFWYIGEVATGSPFYAMISAYGFNAFGANGTDEKNPGFDTAEFKKGLEVVQAYKEILPVKASDLSNADFLQTQFAEGKSAYMMGGPWNIKILREKKVNFGIVPLPTINGKQQRSFAFVQNAFVSEYSKYPNAAQLFAEYLSSAESAETLYKTTARITARADYASVNGLKDDKNSLAIADAFSKSVLQPTASTLNYYWTIMGTIAPALWDGKMTIDQTVDKAKQSWDIAMKSAS